MRDKEIKIIEKDKLHWIAMAKCAADATEILTKNKRNEDLLVRELDILLFWHQIPKSECSDKKQKLAKWIELKVKKPPFFAPWTDTDEAKLVEMKKKDIKLEDTALGRLRDVRKREQEAAFQSSSREEREKILKWLKNLHDAAGESEGKMEEKGKKRQHTVAMNNAMMSGAEESDTKGDQDVTFVANQAAI